jgi:hypothetical protein
MRRYEYNFVDVDFGWWGHRIKEDYHGVIERHGEQGWRLVQIFAPSTGAGGNVRFVEMIFEREKE